MIDGLNHFLISIQLILISDEYRVLGQALSIMKDFKITRPFEAALKGPSSIFRTRHGLFSIV
jgi:hypothetical protein